MSYSSSLVAQACMTMFFVRLTSRILCLVRSPCRPAIYRSGFKCSKCNKSFTSKDIFLDLTVTSGTKEYSEQKPARTELFRSPLVSFLYERGWRQNFNRSGFPGLDEEVHFWVTLLSTESVFKNLVHDTIKQ